MSSVGSYVFSDDVEVGLTDFNALWSSGQKTWFQDMSTYHSKAIFLDELRKIQKISTRMISVRVENTTLNLLMTKQEC
jgi:hypothetical protein